MVETENWKMGDPIIVNDSLENWIIYKEDNSYLLALKVEPNGDGIRHVTSDITEGMQTWWWRQAVERAEKVIEELAVPWGELAITDLELQDGNMMIFSEKLARTSFYIVQVNNRLTRLLALQSAAKEALDHAVNRILARKGNDEEGRKPAADIRRAAAISRDKRLRNLKIELIEAGAQIKALETMKDSLEVLWRTISRCLSIRLREPIE